MDNVDVLVEKEDEQVPEVSKTSEINDEVVPKTIEEETTATENKEIVEKQTENAAVVGDNKADEIDAALPTTTETVESEPVIEEQENVNGTSTIPASVSPGRSNLPFKEVNESDNDEAAVVASTATAENSNTKKRELDHEDEQPQEKTGEYDERAGDQVKKLKLNEPTEASTEPKECETNNTHSITNGNSAVEV
jgi:hypothetical protein